MHSKGLRFGIHIMRGIPKQTVDKSLPVLGTNVRAADIALTHSTCPRNPDMYGVDARKPEGQAYYTFTTRGVMTSNGSFVFAVLVDRSNLDTKDTNLVTVDFASLGLSGKVRVRDLWDHKDLGVFSGSFGRELRTHASALYCLSPVSARQ